MIDVPEQIEAVTRTLRTEEIDAEPSYVQTISQDYPAGIEDVWDATTSAERIARWFMPVTGELRLGGRYQLVGNAGGEILECTPPADGTAAFRVTWEYGGGMSWVVVRLSEQGPERTRFELEHIARTADMPEELWTTFGPGATGVGWDLGLLGLALHLGTQDAQIPPDQAEAWALSEEGKSFTRAAADRWAQAHIAWGADPDTARRCGDATYGFYTGQAPQA